MSIRDNTAIEIICKYHNQKKCSKYEEGNGGHIFYGMPLCLYAKYYELFEKGLRYNELTNKPNQPDLCQIYCSNKEMKDLAIKEYVKGEIK